MVNQDLIDYVRDQRQEGVSDQAIREAVLAVGWTAEDVDQALTDSGSFPPSVPPVIDNPPENINQPEPVMTGNPVSSEAMVDQMVNEETVISKDDFGYQANQPAVEDNPLPQETTASRPVNEEPVKIPDEPNQEVAAVQDENLPPTDSLSVPLSQEETPVDESSLPVDQPIPLAQTPSSQEDLVQDSSSLTESLAKDNEAPITLDESGQVVDGSPQPSQNNQDQVLPLTTEADLAKPVSFPHDTLTSASGPTPSVIDQPIRPPVESVPITKDSSSPISLPKIKPVADNQKPQIAVDPQVKNR